MQRKHLELMQLIELRLSFHGYVAVPPCFANTKLLLG